MKENVFVLNCICLWHQRAMTVLQLEWHVTHPVDCLLLQELIGKFLFGMSMVAFALITSKVIRELSVVSCFILTLINLL